MGMRLSCSLPYITESTVQWFGPVAIMPYSVLSKSSTFPTMQPFFAIFSQEYLKDLRNKCPVAMVLVILCAVGMTLYLDQYWRCYYK